MGKHKVGNDIRKIQLIAVSIISIFFIMWYTAPINSFNYSDYDYKQVTSEHVMQILKTDPDFTVLVFNEDKGKYYNYGKILKGVDSDNYIELDSLNNVEVTDSVKQTTKDDIKAFSKTYVRPWIYQSELIRDTQENVIGMAFKRVANKQYTEYRGEL